MCVCVFMCVIERVREKDMIQGRGAALCKAVWRGRDLCRWGFPHAAACSGGERLRQRQTLLSVFLSFFLSFFLSVFLSFFLPFVLSFCLSSFLSFFLCFFLAVLVLVLALLLRDRRTEIQRENETETQ